MSQVSDAWEPCSLRKCLDVVPDPTDDDWGDRSYELALVGKVFHVVSRISETEYKIYCIWTDGFLFPMTYKTSWPSELFHGDHPLRRANFTIPEPPK